MNFITSKINPVQEKHFTDAARRINALIEAPTWDDLGKTPGYDVFKPQFDAVMRAAETNCQIEFEIWLDNAINETSI